jgi:hypothetical protein
MILDSNSYSSIKLITGILLLGSILALVTLLIFKLFKFLFREKIIFGINIETRIIGLGISSLLVPEGIYSTFVSPIIDIFNTLVLLYNKISSVTYTGDSEFYLLLDRLVASLQEVLYNYQSIVRSYDFNSIILFITLWVVSSLILNKYLYKNNSLNISSVSISQKHYVIVFAILFASLYLVIAAIIAVPYLKDDNTSYVGVDELKKNIFVINSKYKNYEMSSLSVEPILFFSDTIVDTILDPQKKQLIVNRIFGIKDTYEKALQDRQLLVDKINNFKKALNIDTVFDELVNQYKAEEVNLKPKQKLDYINNLSHYFENQLSNKYNSLDFVVQEIKSSDRQLKYDIDFSKSNLIADVKTSINSIVGSPLIINQKSQYYPENISEILFLGPNNINHAPEPPIPGSELGIFRKFSQWLIFPNSMALVLIAGMIGFGLFGATISTFIKDGSLKEAGLMRSDIYSIIIRGFSAAIVIFLGVMGGLAIFSTSQAEPNPYALFFTCLVGAVYSEKIWEWAQEKLKTTLGSSIETPGNEKEQN